MSFSSLEQWWEEWQLRILVLGSLGTQLYLAFFAPLRKFRLWPLDRLFIWLAYLGGDALAIYALATLFNRQKKEQCNSSYGIHDLEVLWAPILLMHLGGRMSISSYNIEDNELWGRHIGTSVSQVVVTVYVFRKSWSPLADRRLLAAAILLFILGVYRCFEKPYALRRASFNNLISSFHPAPMAETTSREVELEQYIQEARDFVKHNEDPPILDQDEIQPHIEQLSMSDKLFVDSTYSYGDRLKKLKSFWLLDQEKAYELLLIGQSKTFDLIYTKLWQIPDQNRDATWLGTFFSVQLWNITLTFPIAAIVLFHISHKQAYRGSDIKVTYILLYLTYFSDILTAPGRLFVREWSDMVAQHSLIGALPNGPGQTILLRIAKCICCTDLLHKYVFVDSCKSKDITDLVRGHVKDGWMNYISDVESYWKFTDIKGHWTLKHNRCEESLRGSIEKPFDESIILWHVATDFCFYRKGISIPPPCARFCRQISNYMMHLLFANPEMLLPGSRRTLLDTAYSELEAILQGEFLRKLDVKGLTQRVIDKVECREGSNHLLEMRESLIGGAWILAQKLMELGDQKKMWDVITGVWLEMLCFSAGRCRGYLHAKSLGSGGEFLSFVSLLMSHAGLETFAERQQRVQLSLPKEERVKIAKQRIEETARNQALLEVIAHIN